MRWSGLLLIHKPQAVSSSYVTARVKKIVRAQAGQKLKVGHMGTLDPFATGLLPVAIGQATKLLPMISHHPKTYRFTVQWGAETTTADLTGEVTETSTYYPIEDDIRNILSQFRGHILQVPPRFSALKVKGRRAYDLARSGVSFELAARAQYIFRLELLTHTYQTATFEVTCNTGTYVRTLGQDMARALHTRGHLISLQRTAIGSWDLSRSIPLDSFCEMTHDEPYLRTLIIRPTELLDDIPALEVDEKEAQLLSRGQPLIREERPPGSVVACTRDGLLMALVREERGVLAPFRVFWNDKRSAHDVDDERT